MLSKLILMVSLLTGCGAAADDEALCVASGFTYCPVKTQGGAYLYNNSDYSSFVAHFEDIAKVVIGPTYAITTTIVLSTTPIVIAGDTPPPGDFFAGECTCGGPTSRAIVLDPQWVHLAPGDQEEVVLHELGHCELYRPHLNTDLSSGDPTSIMAADAMTGSYAGNPDYYDQELFSVINKDCSDVGPLGGTK